MKFIDLPINQSTTKMQKLTVITILLFFTYSCYAQTNATAKISNGDSEKVATLNKVTIGFSAGYSQTFDRVYDYSLSTDGYHSLKLQPLSKGAFVISSTLSIKLKELAVGEKTKSLYTYEKDSKGIAGYRLADDFVDIFLKRTAVNVSLNLVDIGNGNVSFNKSIDGGIGLGFYINDYLQIAGFYDIKSVRQLRDYVVQDYQNKSIPIGNGNEAYNALDTSDDNLFYSKIIRGWSIKIVFSLANKKQS